MKIDDFKNKYFFIGMITGLIPYTILLSIISSDDKVSSTFKLMLIISAIITSFINGFILRYNALLKFKRSLN